MKYSISFVFACFIFSVFALTANAQYSRGLGGRSLSLDDSLGHTITLETPMPGDSGYAAWIAEGGSSVWKLPIPPFPNANAGFVLPGDSAGQLLVWVPAPDGGPQGAWEPMNIGDLGIGGGGGGGDKGGFTGSGSDSTIAIWTGANSLGNSSLTENGTTLSYSGSDINTTTDYQIGGTTILTTPGTGNTFLGANTGFESGLGSHSTALGCGARFGDGDEGGVNRTAVGAKAYCEENNALVLGSIQGENNATASTSVGIGTTAPAAALDVQGGSSNDALHLTTSNSEGFGNDVVGDSWSVNGSGQLTAGGTDAPAFNAAVTLDNGHLAAIEDNFIFGTVAPGDSDEDERFPNMIFNSLSCGSSDVAGLIDFNIYHSAGGQYAEVDFAESYSGSEIVTITPANEAAAIDLSSFYVSVDPEGNYFRINIDSQTPGNQEYQFFYHVIDVQCSQESTNKHHQSPH